MTRYLLIITLCLCTAGCATEIEKAQPGDSTATIHVLDAVTGKCVAINGAGDSFGMMVVEQSACRRLPMESNR